MDSAWPEWESLLAAPDEPCEAWQSTFARQAACGQSAEQAACGQSTEQAANNNLNARVFCGEEQTPDQVVRVRRECCGRTCGHGRVRELEPCRDCWEAVMKMAWAQSREQKRLEWATGAQERCAHGSERRRCRVCRGSWVCMHGLHKVYCRECDGRRLCQSCFKKSMPRCNAVCKACRREKKSLESLERGKFVLLV